MSEMMVETTEQMIARLQAVFVDVRLHLERAEMELEGVCRDLNGEANSRRAEDNGGVAVWLDSLWQTFARWRGEPRGSGKQRTGCAITWPLARLTRPWSSLRQSAIA